MKQHGKKKKAESTGKTLAYLLPILERLLYLSSNSPAVTRVLILVPTRKLVGGLDLQVQEAMLLENLDIVIATPGRLIGHIKEREGDREAVLAASICRTFHDHTYYLVY
ncbi:probable ATP-dependent RNA helicase DDX27 [Aphidius gifuensis]|uniref:probable ATP-dependent RNA helicase DDX27 n=1 Tax=Aphidius gifuensis TaxID=684658 RepID=UPI001CDBD972|nr:probable ATP-dependent RNA helicase DDX27 [Aphidius gifuensis]